MAALLVSAGVTAAVTIIPGPPAVVTSNVTIDAPEAPGAPGLVHLDATVYLPARTPAPAVLVAHGFGGSKNSVAPLASALARR
ncbi:MAG TPA: hypothetical protein VFO16_17430, partial [Pseudonocardiaceae bacterium]|nr:hypothetical protein [Pseudonocardiaceae bacterium]